MSIDKRRAMRFKHATRFIDDECNLNDGGEFGRSFRSIYPPELEVKCEHEGTHATFYDLEINISDDIFVYKLFDKRDDFPFLSFVCLIYQVTSLHMCFIVLLCLSFSE